MHTGAQASDFAAAGAEAWADAGRPMGAAYDATTGITTVSYTHLDVYKRQVWYLTGTPMENRVEEFRRLIKRLRPAVELDFSAVDALAGPARFRAAVAPV